MIDQRRLVRGGTVVYEFKGWDWTELAEALGVELAEEEKDGVMGADGVSGEEKVKNFLEDEMAREASNGEVSAIVRRFVCALAMEAERIKCTAAPVWRAIAGLGDFEILQWTYRLLEHMWT